MPLLAVYYYQHADSQYLVEVIIKESAIKICEKESPIKKAFNVVAKRVQWKYTKN